MATWRAGVTQRFADTEGAGLSALLDAAMASTKVRRYKIYVRERKSTTGIEFELLMIAV